MPCLQTGLRETSKKKEFRSFSREDDSAAIVSEGFRVRNKDFNIDIGCIQRKMLWSKEGIDPSTATIGAGITQDHVEGVEGGGELVGGHRVNQLH